MISRRHVLAVRAVSVGVVLLAAAGVADSLAGRDVRSVLKLLDSDGVVRVVG